METLKGLGWMALGICAMVAVAFLAMLIFSGIGYVSAILMPWLIDAAWWAFAICLIVLLPLSFFRGTRGVAFAGFFIGSFAFGTCAWVLGFLVSYSLWGFIGVAIGLFIFGVGVVPVAILAAAFHGSWEVVLELIVLIALTFGTRSYAAYLYSKVDQDSYERSILDLKAE